LDAVEHHGAIIEVLRYGHVIARLVPASATVVLADLPPAPSVVPVIEIPGETAVKP
jgi:antitoxin (DNA-binding transcriptional repressor) of toxin-antitoxin stability system